MVLVEVVVARGLTTSSARMARSLCSPTCQNRRNPCSSCWRLSLLRKASCSSSVTRSTTSFRASGVGLTGPPEVSNLPALVLQVVIFAALGVGLIAIARGWWLSKYGARAPFILAQILGLVVGVPLTAAPDAGTRVVGASVGSGRSHRYRGITAAAGDTGDCR